MCSTWSTSILSTPPDTLIAAIRTIADGNAIVSPRVTRTMLDLYQGQLPDPAGPQQNLGLFLGLDSKDIPVEKTHATAAPLLAAASGHV